MNRVARSVVVALALLITFWLIWSRLHIVIFVAMPWWGLLIMAVVIFLVVDYILDRLLRRAP